ncbi:hydrolase TatD [Candidatus Falkowbacteria bacterium CG10_big_fil_rev_8_21_14_0_10_39_9]|uniref:Hydrolase TatD n=1 Tax=Candidatus Falkowbacteria bacterium CG10_big_fil_rev_8_21_14_0_10_39_9 TaxID=1974566 RepID=A0A2M6WPM4_9BACT|nr:MAG: hydrolase TatD [Candidatus Falkowbacteria bacterium CG10_big_fil_rev_8_21_14_0_10_39_9]
MYIDTHCHLNFKDFKEDADEVISRSLADNTQMILVGSEQKTSKRAVEYANKYDSGVYAAIGLHPIHLEDISVKNDSAEGKYEFESHAEAFNYEYYYNLAHNNKKVVAIGEIGLDYYHLPEDKNIPEVKLHQQQVLKELLLLAHNLKLPVIIHCREAHDDLLPLLTDFYEQYKTDQKREWGVIHCFSGDEKLAAQYQELNLMISFTGLITFAKNWDEVIKNFPLEKIMIETDSPYMAPVLFRGKRNEPIYVKYVAEKIAQLKGLTNKEVEDRTFANAQRVFGL